MRARVVMLALLIGLAGCLADSNSPTPSAAASDASTGFSGECDFDPTVFPEFGATVMHSIVLVDQSGLATGCRHVGFDERTLILDAFGPQLPLAISDRSLLVRRANADGTRLLLMWVTLRCDVGARVTIADGAANPAVHVRQVSEGPCAPGTGLKTIEIASREAVDAEDVIATISHDPAR